MKSGHSAAAILAAMSFVDASIAFLIKSEDASTRACTRCGVQSPDRDAPHR
jgi:hypothetical protein